MKTNPEILEEIMMIETMELRTPHPSQCICIYCQKQKYDYVQRCIPKILREFIRKPKIKKLRE